jgi:hypothetical protein
MAYDHAASNNPKWRVMERLGQRHRERDLKRHAGPGVLLEPAGVADPLKDVARPGLDHHEQHGVADGLQIEAEEGLRRFQPLAAGAADHGGPGCAAGAGRLDDRLGAFVVHQGDDELHPHDSTLLL